MRTHPARARSAATNRRAAHDEERRADRIGPVAGRAAVTSVNSALDDGLRSDLRAWIRGYYAECARLKAERVGQAVERVFDRERMLLVALSGILMLGIASMPWLGPAGVLCGLAILYVGTLVSAVATLRRVRELRSLVPTTIPNEDVEQTLASCPLVDSGGRALLVRLMNLSTARPTPRSRELLGETLAEALARTDLASWPFLHALVELLDGPDGRRVGPLSEAAMPTAPASAGHSPLGRLRQSTHRPR